MSEIEQQLKIKIKDVREANCKPSFSKQQH